MSVAPNEDPGRFYTALFSGIASLIITPVQITAFMVIVSHSDLRRNASYLLLARLILCEFFQSIALVITAIFIMFPETKNIGVLYVFSCLSLCCLFLAGFPLMWELSIYRILVFMKRCHPEKLPLAMIIFEAFCWLLLFALAIAVYLTDSMVFDGYTWSYVEDNTVAIFLNYTELFFCIPVILITYFAYLVLIFLIYGTRSRYSKDSYAKTEWTLFLKSSLINFYYVVLIVNWHVVDPLTIKNFSISLAFLSSITWATAYYWTSALLLCFNKSVRSKLFNFRKKKFVIASTNVASNVASVNKT